MIDSPLCTIIICVLFSLFSGLPIPPWPKGKYEPTTLPKCSRSFLCLDLLLPTNVSKPEQISDPNSCPKTTPQIKLLRDFFFFNLSSFLVN